MQDMTPGLAPDPKMLPPFPSLGITDRLRRPILDHMLLGTRQNCNIIEKLLSKSAPLSSHLVSRATRNDINDIASMGSSKEQYDNIILYE